MNQNIKINVSKKHHCNFLECLWYWNKTLIWPINTLTGENIYQRCYKHIFDRLSELRYSVEINKALYINHDYLLSTVCIDFLAQIKTSHTIAQIFKQWLLEAFTKVTEIIHNFLTKCYFVCLLQTKTSYLLSPFKVDKQCASVK